MKVALNGVAQVSILDGWWIEGFNGRKEWAIGTAAGDGDRNAGDAEALCQVLEYEIVPLFYRMSDESIPGEGGQVMKETIRSNAVRFSARRMMKEYLRTFYSQILSEAWPEL